MTKEQHGDPMRMDLQWFGEEGNPGQASGEGASAPETFVTDLASKPTGSGADPASQEGAQGQNPEAGQQQGAKATEPLPPWTSATSKDVRADPRFAAFASKFKSFDEAVKSAMELESKVGGMVSRLAENATAEEIAEYNKKTGVPTTPAEYKLDRIPLLEKDSSDAEFRDFMHKNHVPQETAAALYKLIAERTTQQVQAINDAITQGKKSLQSALQKEWGNDYGANLEIVNRGIAAYAPAGLIDEIKANGLGNSKALIMMFHRIGQLVQEDSAASRRNAGRPGDTPRASGGFDYAGLE